MLWLFFHLDWVVFAKTTKNHDFKPFLWICLWGLDFFRIEKSRGREFFQRKNHGAESFFDGKNHGAESFFKGKNHGAESFFEGKNYGALTFFSPPKIWLPGPGFNKFCSLPK